MLTQPNPFHQPIVSHNRPAHASKVDSRWGGMGQMRRYKREGRRILTRFLGLWDESRNRRTFHRLRNLCDSRSSRTHRSRCPIPPQRRPTSLNPHLLLIPELHWCHIICFFKKPVEVLYVLVADGERYVFYRHITAFQQCPCFLHPNFLYQISECHP